MTVGIYLDNILLEIGHPDFLHAFFSTVSGNLEPEGWGSRFPTLMQQLYQGRVEGNQAAAALAELRIVKGELAQLSPQKMIWDIEDSSATPPWGSNISPEITSLANYFITSGGCDFIAELEEMLLYCDAEKAPLIIGAYDNPIAYIESQKR